jgi:crossover junction endodeoxyribonuclease RuvC
MIARMAKAEAMAAEQKRKYDARLAEERKARAAVARKIEKLAKKEAGAR